MRNLQITKLVATIGCLLMLPAIAQGQATVNVDSTIESVVAITLAGCSGGLSLSLDASLGTDTDIQSCEFTVEANAPWDLDFQESTSGTGLDGTYEQDLEFGGGTGHPYVILDCDEDENGAGTTCDLTDSVTETSHSEWGLWFTDGPTGSQTLAPTTCNAQSTACALKSGSKKLLDEASITNGITEGIDINIYAFIDSTVKASNGYEDGVEIMISID